MRRSSIRVDVLAVPKGFEPLTPITAADLLNDRVIPVEKSSAPKGLHNHERIDLLMKEVATEEPFDKGALRK